MPASFSRRTEVVIDCLFRIALTLILPSYCRRHFLLDDLNAKQMDFIDEWEQKSGNTCVPRSYIFEKEHAAISS